MLFISPRAQLGSAREDLARRFAVRADRRETLAGPRDVLYWSLLSPCQVPMHPDPGTSKQPTPLPRLLRSPGRHLSAAPPPTDPASTNITICEQYDDAPAAP